MMLHITYIDGSNPYLMYASKKDCKREWNWQAARNKHARPLFMAGGLQCRRVAGGGWAVARYFDGAHKTKHYTRLGDALNALERSGGERA
jgi:hypothetical protein